MPDTQEKQIIEEMAVTIANFRIQICKIGNCKTCTSRIDTNKECYFVKQAKVLYKSGYRKERQGKWIRRENKSPTQTEAYCSMCGRDAVYQVADNRWQFENYCPHCGAKMKGADNE
jgi:predicted RNA-binding Zn-ribbon protein involved in translation (DUF1610 family)